MIHIIIVQIASKFESKRIDLRATDIQSTVSKDLSVQKEEVLGPPLSEFLVKLRKSQDNGRGF